MNDMTKDRREKTVTVLLSMILELVLKKRNCSRSLRHQGFPCGSAGKESACNVGDLGLIPGLGKSPGEGKCYPFQYSGLENSMDCIVRGVAKSRTQLSDFHFHITLNKRQTKKNLWKFILCMSSAFMFFLVADIAASVAKETLKYRNSFSVGIKFLNVFIWFTTSSSFYVFSPGHTWSSDV